ncbi:unnamed protein product, partial [marine sediment metagenome]
THKGTGKLDLQENIRRSEREKKEEKLKIKNDLSGNTVTL